MRSLLALLALLALLLASAAHAQAPSPAQMGITSTTTPEVLQTLDLSKTWVPIGAVNPTNHAFAPWPGTGVYSVLAWGADPTGVADSSAAFRSALAYAAANNGGTVLVPLGSYALDPTSGPFSISGSNVTLRCEGAFPNAGQLMQSTDTGDLFTITGSYNRIVGCQFSPSHIILSKGYAVRVQNGCYFCSVENVAMTYMWRGVAVGKSADFKVDTLSGTDFFSPVLIYLGGQADNVGGNFTTAPRISRVVANNPPPSGFSPTNLVTWATSLAVTLNQFALVNGAVYMVTQAGTTAATGTGPSGYPSGVTTPAAVWTTPITDGTAQWQYVESCPAENGRTAWIVQDSWAATVRIDHAELLSGCTGFSMVDSLNTGTSYPLFSEHNDLELERNFFNDMYLDKGSALQSVNGYSSISLSESGIRINAGFGGAMFSNMLVDNNAQYGFSIAGSKGVQIAHSQIYNNGNSNAAAGTYHNISVGNAANYFSITNNFLGLWTLPNGPGTPKTGYGVVVAAGASDYYVITGNICGGVNVTGCVIDAGTGTHKTVSGNW